MAKLVDFRTFTPKNSRRDLARRLQDAPDEHQEALLSTYDLLERLHEKGIIDLLNGLLSAGDTLIERVADVISSREAVTALRIALILGNLLTSIDPDKLHAVISGAENDEPPSLMSIAKQALSKEARRGMAAGLGLLAVFGATLSKQQT